MLIGYTLICLIFGTTFLAIKIGINAGFPPLLFAGLRFTVGGLITLALVLLRRRSLPVSRADYRDIALVGLTSTIVPFAGLFWAEQFISSGLASILTSILPMLTMLTAARRTRPSHVQWLGVVAGTAGVVLVSFPGLDMGVRGIALAAIATVILGEFSTAWGGHRAKEVMSRGTDSQVLAALQMLTGGLGLLLGSLLFEHRLPHGMPAAGWVALLYLTIIGSVVARGLYYWLISRMGPLLPSTWTYVSPIIATFVGAWLLAEPFTWGTLAGLLLVLTGAALTDLPSLKLMIGTLKRGPAAVPLP